MHIDPTHHLHIDKITRGVNLHVTLTLEYSIAIESWMDAYRKTLVGTTCHSNYETCID